MPAYEYECNRCGNHFSVTQTIKEHGRDNVKCPKCSSEDVKHVIEQVFVSTSRKS